ncbi:MAG TPA: S41 family peptidase [Pyrinomonadaceae bacterium]|jgi:carboxyl-terminal processing protease|nr:S41 family peptidase [Pyrinomonadaceae bacterium]
MKFKRHAPRTRKVTALWLAALCLLACLSGAARPAVNSSGREARLRVFDEVWEQVRARYFDPGLHGVDWQEMRRALRPQAEEAGSVEELYAVLRRMLASLRDPHTRVFAPGEGADWRVRRFVTVGVSVRESEGAVVVSNVERESAAGRAGLRAGDEVLSVAGEAVSSVIARRLAERPAANSSSARRLALARLFEGPPETEVEVAFRRAGEARARTARLRRVVAVRAPSFEARLASGRVGVVRFNIFTQEMAPRLSRALGGELKEARALVVDLRENGGGETESMADVVSTLLPAELSLGRFTGRDGRLLLEPFTRSALLTSAEELRRFEGPVVVLTGARTASASEVFAAALRERGRARLLGEATCGCVLGIRRRHPLPDGGILDISEMDYRTASGRRLEGSGLSPDETVEPTREDLRRGRDPAMERALQLLKSTVRD